MKTGALKGDYRFPANIGGMGKMGGMGENAHYMLWRTFNSATLNLHTHHTKPGNAGRSQ